MFMIFFVTSAAVVVLEAPTCLLGRLLVAAVLFVFFVWADDGSANMLMFVHQPHFTLSLYPRPRVSLGMKA